MMSESDISNKSSGHLMTSSSMKSSQRGEPGSGLGACSGGGTKGGASPTASGAAQTGSGEDGSPSEGGRETRL